MDRARWIIAQSDEKTVERLQSQVGCPPAIARLLAARGITDLDAAQKFLTPSLEDLHDPLLMLGMQPAVERIRSAVTSGESILIYGDYDVDGTTATVLLKTAIERIATPGKPARVTYHVPHRLREGYGIQNGRLAEAAAEGVRLVISVDTGIRAFAAAKEARALGLDLIVTDHHLPDGAGGNPDALAVINPAQPGCPYPNKHLCGAGVAFKLAHALLLSHAQDDAARNRIAKVLIPSFLKLVAIATIADSVELTGENRSIVWLGLRELRNPVQPGLRALMQVSRLEIDKSPTAREVGFALGPRINAAGRMDVASDVVELFLTRDHVVASALASKLDLLNDERRATESAALQAIELQLINMRDAAGAYPSECLVLDHPEWHRGVLGILASRVVDRTGRPALVMCAQDGVAHGSGRSIAGFHLLDAVTTIHELKFEGTLFSRFGGHAHAVGFSLPADRLPDLRARMKVHSTQHLAPSLLLPRVDCDLQLTPRELTADLVSWIERCAPFGNGNSEPVFFCPGLRITGPARIIKEIHLCLPVACGPVDLSLNAMGWSRPGHPTWAQRCRDLGLVRGSVIDAAFRLKENKHPSYHGIELELVDIALHPHGHA